MARLEFHGVRFDDDFASASAADGRGLRFTRLERALLSRLAAHPRRLFTREDLFAAMGSRGSDRNVDYVVNRLRAKLGDTAQDRRFIATQYGEGYVWVAEPGEAVEAPGLLVLGPVRGLNDHLLKSLLQPLRDRLHARIGQARGVRLEPDWAADPAAGVHFSLEAAFHRASGRTHAALVLRREPSRETVASFRESFVGDPAPGVIEALAGSVTDAVWKTLALGPRTAPAPTDQPLLMRMQSAAALLDPPGASWLANAEQLARLRAEQPDDPTLAIMWAMQVFARSMMTTQAPGALTRASVSAVEDEIEALVLPHLGAIRDDPVLALAAAKLLLLLNRGHEDLAEALANRAFASSAAFAAAFPMLGQVQAYRGEIAEGCRLYDEGLQLCEPGSPFEVYILVIKAMALIAADDRPAVEATYQRLLEIHPIIRENLGILFLPPGDEGLARTLAPLADKLDLAQARATIAYLHYRVADLFRQPVHSANLMRGPLTHLVRRLGPGVATDEIWRELPHELRYLRATGPRAKRALNAGAEAPEASSAP